MKTQAAFLGSDSKKERGVQYVSLDLRKEQHTALIPSQIFKEHVMEGTQRARYMRVNTVCDIFIQDSENATKISTSKWRIKRVFP